MKKNKTFCKFSKDDIKERLEELISLTRHPRYICRRCARVSNVEVRLCKPLKTGS